MGNNHNRSVAWVRLWSALGATVAAEKAYANTPSADIARELAQYEIRRLDVATYALSTTKGE